MAATAPQLDDIRAIRANMAAELDGWVPAISQAPASTEGMSTCATTLDSTTPREGFQALLWHRLPYRASDFSLRIMVNRLPKGATGSQDP
jgi:hypothetical protein